MNRAAFLESAGTLLATAPAIRIAASPIGVNARVRAIARDLSGRIGVYARTLASGPALATYAASARFPTASVIKLLIMTTAYVKEEASPGTLSATITFRSSELIGGSDFLAGASDGQRFTVYQLVAPMIRVSDNTAANLLIDHFGLASINAIGRRAGMDRTRLARKFLDYGAIVRHNDNVSTPADMGQLLYLIERGAREGIRTIVSAEHCRAMIAIMLGQTDRDGIPAALPQGTQVANKTGALDGTRNDVAIVEPYGDSPFVLAIMTADLDDYPTAYEAIHGITRATYAGAAGSYE